MKILTAAEMREVDRLTTKRYGVPSLTLMENAGKSVADFIASRFPDFKRRPIVVLCGKGNNGGDGFVAARHLLKMGPNVQAYLVGDPREVKGDAATNLNRWKKANGKLFVDRPGKATVPAEIAGDAIVVDALLGTGVRGAVEGRLAEVISSVNRRKPGCDVVAVDIPSGLQADTGEIAGPVIVADYTITFTAPKPGLLLGASAQHVGELIVRDIGSPGDLIVGVGKGNLWWTEPDDFAFFALRRKPEGHKGDYGHALIVAGSVGKSGAAVLASWAALRAGAGLVTVATPEPVLPIVAAHTPEVMTEPLGATRAGTISQRSLEGNLFATLLKGKRALAVGPGLTTQDETQSFVRTVVKSQSNVPIVLDADGLNAFAGRAAELKDRKGLLAVTPHPGEMSRLTGRTTEEIQSNRIEIALKAAADWNAIVVLKGHHTVIAAPDGFAYINSTGNPGMGTGGTGDVLTGMLAGLVAQYGRELNTAGYAQLIAFGVYLHGLAGDIAYADYTGAPLMASDLIRALPRAYAQFYAECARA
jgi:ADP-dependent NAD(P)H-hydrate dehydratase / NAD(P)H-hydrate epimerase